MSNENFDLAIIGGGPGGYVAAIRASQNGLKTALIEKETLGGECLNHGCIPSKALIHVAEAYSGLSALAGMGVQVSGVTLDLSAAVEWKNKIVKRLTTGVGSLMKANAVTVINGIASFLDNRTVRVVAGSEERNIHAGQVMIAVGTTPISLSALPLDGQLIISHREALAPARLPARLLVVGGGYIGLELGMMYAKFGSAVTIVEVLERMLPGTQTEALRVINRNLRRLKMKVLTRTKVTGMVRANNSAMVTLENAEGATEMLKVDQVLVTVGRRPSTAGLGLENTEVALDEKGFIKVDAQRRTTEPSIFAVGDVAGPPLLAHKASAEGLVAADAAAGKPAAFNPRAIPAVVFADPEVAVVGLSKEEAIKRGYDAEEASFPFLALGRALTMNSGDGFARWIFSATDKQILGCEIVGPDASSLIGEAALAVEKKLTLDDVAGTIHPHPTLSEALMEAAELGLGHPIHLPKK